MNRTRRTALATGTGVAAATLAFIAVPTADAAPTEPVPATVTASEWACLALGEVDLGLCLDNPIPDTSGLPTVPEILEDVLGILG